MLKIVYTKGCHTDRVDYRNIVVGITGVSKSHLQHFLLLFSNLGARGGVVVKGLRYKPAGRGFDSRWCQDFSP